MFKLEVEKRDRIGKSSKRREGGNFPAVLYGPKEPSTSISISMKSFLDVWREAGESSVIEVTGLGESKEALVHDVDVDPVSGKVRHADLYIIEKGKKIEIGVPLTFIGEAPAVKELGGTLVKVLHELQIEVMPKDLPHEISVDISDLTDFEKQIHVSDLALPTGVVSLTDPDEVVALVAEVKEEEEEFVETPDLESIEVEQRGKQDTEEGGESGSGSGSEGEKKEG